MSDETNYENELREWRFEAPTREHLLEQRIKKLEQAVSRLEKKGSDTVNGKQESNIVKNWLGLKTIGATAGIVGVVHPISPYKAD